MPIYAITLGTVVLVEAIDEEHAVRIAKEHVEDPVPQGVEKYYCTDILKIIHNHNVNVEGYDTSFVPYGNKEGKTIAEILKTIAEILKEDK